MTSRVAHEQSWPLGRVDLRQGAFPIQEESLSVLDCCEEVRRFSPVKTQPPSLASGDGRLRAASHSRHGSIRSRSEPSRQVVADPKKIILANYQRSFCPGTRVKAFVVAMTRAG